jgi:urease accessory protein UreH
MKALMLAGCVLLSAGCAAVLVGAGGTALWQHGKIVSEEPRSLEAVKTAAKEALKVKKVVINDEIARDNFLQLRGQDPEGKKIAVDIIETGKDAVRLEIRVGAGERQPARDILLELKRQLYEKSGFKLF